MTILGLDAVSYDEDSLKVDDKQEQEITTLQEPVKQTNKKRIRSHTCSHLGTMAGICRFCGEKMDDDYGIPFRYIHKKLRYSVQGIDIIREHRFKDLLERRKLYLVLDLDHTLLHSVHVSKLSTVEKLLYENMDSLPDSLRHSLHRVERINMMTKLRPFVHSFLKEASELFEISICTLGPRCYAGEMVKLLDPDKVYFKERSKVIAKEDCPGGNRKYLDNFLGKVNAVIILDDTERVWKNNKRNLIVAERYNYFAAEHKHYNLKSHSVLKTDESESTGTLATALEVLRCIHAEFFDVADKNEDLAHQDVRQVVSMMIGESNPKLHLFC